MKYLPLLLGVISILGASYQLYRNTRLMMTGQSTEGVVIRNEKSMGKSTVYYPIVQFQTPTGQTYQCKGQSGTYPAEYDIDDIVSVHYDPTQPTNAFIGSYFGVLQGAFFCIGLGVLFSWLGLNIVRGTLNGQAETTEGDKPDQLHA